MRVLRLSIASAMAPASHAFSFSYPFLSNRRHSLSNPNPNRTFIVFSPLTPRRTTAMKIAPMSSMSEQPVEEDKGEKDPPHPLSLSSNSEKRSFAVATGELFIGIASRFIPGQRVNNSIPRVSDSGEKLADGERIATVVEDPLQPEVLWEQRVKDVEAEKRRKMVTSPGFSFSAAGLLFPYHLGVAQFLIEKGYIKETTPLAGSSAGAIICAVIASGSSMEDALRATKILAADCRLRGTAFRLGAVLRDVLDKILPDDVHTRCNGRVRDVFKEETPANVGYGGGSDVRNLAPMITEKLFRASVTQIHMDVELIIDHNKINPWLAKRLAVTQITWRPRGLLIDQFDSREDLINALFTSSFIPGYLAPRPATMFRNRLCIDGGLTLFMPPTSAPQTVRVCAFPASSLRFRGIGISPDCNPENKLSTWQLLNWALEPADDYILDNLFEFGYLDAAVWAEENSIL